MARPADRNPGLNQSFLADTPSDLKEHHPNAAVVADPDGGTEAYELGGTRTANNAMASPSAPEGVVDATSAASRRRTFQPGDLAHTPSMDGPAATRPMKATDKALSPAEAPMSSD